MDMRTMKEKNEAATPHFVNTEDSQGGPVQYWRMWLYCSDGQTVAGIGVTEEQARLEAMIKHREREKQLALPDVEYLKLLLGKSEMYENDRREAIRIMMRCVVVLMEKENMT